MWPFAEEKLAEPEPAPTVDYVEALRIRVVEVKDKLGRLDSEMLHFKTNNSLRATRSGRILEIRCASITGRPAIERAWRDLLFRRDQLVAQWHRVLFDWADARNARDRERKENAP